jgi:hypothetical protein
MGISAVQLNTFTTCVMHRYPAGHRNGMSNGYTLHQANGSMDDRDLGSQVCFGGCHTSSCYEAIQHLWSARLKAGGMSSDAKSHILLVSLWQSDFPVESSAAADVGTNLEGRSEAAFSRSSGGDDATDVWSTQVPPPAHASLKQPHCMSASAMAQSVRALCCHALAYSIAGVCLRSMLSPAKVHWL